MASAWINQVFSAGQVNKGNVVRRSRRTVERYTTFTELKAEVERRGFHLIETGDQLIIICNEGNFRMHC